MLPNRPKMPFDEKEGFEKVQILGKPSKRLRDNSCNMIATELQKGY